MTSLAEAERDIPMSVLPVQGLRRTGEGQLTGDAIQIVLDGLKSRGIDITDKRTKDGLLKELVSLLCNVNAQYQFLLKEITRKLTAGEPIPKSLLATALQKNLFVSDILTVSRHLYAVKPFDGSSEFIEGWQASARGPTGLETYFPGIESFQSALENQQAALQSGSTEELRRHMVTVTQEKNRHASNYLGLYGFLNIVAVGLLIYIAGMKSQA